MVETFEKSRTAVFNAVLQWDISSRVYNYKYGVWSRKGQAENCVTRSRFAKTTDHLFLVDQTRAKAMRLLLCTGAQKPR
jgi:hypothetical protein